VMWLHASGHFKVLVPRLRRQPFTAIGDMTVERQNANGTWQFVDQVPVTDA
jgi:hypothetical protein